MNVIFLVIIKVLFCSVKTEAYFFSGKAIKYSGTTCATMQQYTAVYKFYITCSEFYMNHP